VLVSTINEGVKEIVAVIEGLARALRERDLDS
jgi:hypothetical protein